jgi:hypothetical protein
MKKHGRNPVGWSWYDAAPGQSVSSRKAENVTTMKYFEDEEKDPAAVIVRRCAGRVALTVSLHVGGDIKRLWIATPPGSAGPS